MWGEVLWVEGGRLKEEDQDVRMPGLDGIKEMGEVTGSLPGTPGGVGGMVTLTGVLERFVASLTEGGRGLWACLQVSVSPSDSPVSPSRTQALPSAALSRWAAWGVTAAWPGRKVRQGRGTGTGSLVPPLHTAPWPRCQAHPLHGLS